jgi:hypothetical protein
MEQINKFLDWFERLSTAFQIAGFVLGGSSVTALSAIFGDMPWPWVVLFALIGAVIGFGLFVFHRTWVGEKKRSVQLEKWNARSPVKIMGLKKVPNTPLKDHTAIRLQFCNQSDRAITGLLAKLVDIQPNALSIAKPNQPEKDITLPVNLATKARLDLYRSNGQALPAQRFNLGPFETKEAEVFWLYSAGSLEANITHEAGENDFVFMDDEYRFSVEISGVGRPAHAIARLWKTNVEISAWDCELLED